LPRSDGHLALHFDLATEVHDEDRVGDAADMDSVDPLQCVDDSVGVSFIAHTYGEVAHHRSFAHLNDIDPAHVATGLTDG
jgi:hypothetical protein